MTESLFHRTGKKKTKCEDDQMGAADKSLRSQKKNQVKKNEGSGESSVFQSERYDCFSITDEKLFSQRRHRHTGKTVANMAARDDKNGRQLMNTDRAAAAASEAAGRATATAVCCLFLYEVQFTRANGL